MRLILRDRCWVVLISFVRMVKFIIIIIIIIYYYYYYYYLSIYTTEGWV